MKVWEFCAHLPFALAALAIPVLLLVGGPGAVDSWGSVVVISAFCASGLCAVAYLVLDHRARKEEATIAR